MTPNDLILREALVTDHDDIFIIFIIFIISQKTKNSIMEETSCHIILKNGLNIARISRTSFTNVPFMNVIIKSMCYINLDGLHC